LRTTFDARGRHGPANTTANKRERTPESSAKSSREQAEEILGKVGGMVSTGSDTDGVTGAVIGVGYALLAIHDELRAIRLKYDPPAQEPGTWGQSRVG
jgi:hypothetical protein